MSGEFEMIPAFFLVTLLWSCCNSHQPDQLAPSMLFLAPAHIVDDEGNQKNQKGLGGATDVSWFSKAYKGIYIHI